MEIPSKIQDTMIPPATQRIIIKIDPGMKVIPRDSPSCQAP